MVSMAGSPHSIAKAALREIICENNKKHINYCTLQEVKSIKINDPDSKHVIDYYPDFIIKRNLSANTYYYIVFEVIDKQQDHKTMADIARILAKPEIKRAIFICASGTKKETDRIVHALLGAYKERFSKKKKNDIINLATIEWTKHKNNKKEKQINKTEIFGEIKSLIKT